MISVRRVQSRSIHVWATSLLTVLMASALACSRTPTAPSRRADGSTFTPLSQEAPPVPPRLSDLPPPHALGAIRFVAFGDSLTYGTLSSFDGRFLYDVPSHSYPVRLLLGLRQTFPAQSAAFVVVNAGSPGERASNARDRLQSVLGANDADVLLLLEGINDINAGVSPQRAAASVVDLVQVARLYNVTVLLGLMPQTYDGVDRMDPVEQVVPFNDELRRLTAGVQNVHIVDLYAAFGSDRSLIGGDGLHPTPEGYERMAATFGQRIEDVFPVRGSVQ